MATEIFTSEIPLIQEAFFGNNPNNRNQQKEISEEKAQVETGGADENKTEVQSDNKDENSTQCEENTDKKPSNEQQVAESQEEAKTDSQPSKEEEKRQKFELAHYFFSFLNGEVQNETLIGYFTRVLTFLLQRKQTEVSYLNYLSRD